MPQFHKFDKPSGHEDFALVCVTLWEIWSLRCKAIYEHIFQPPMSAHMFVKSFIGKLDQTPKTKPSSAASKHETGRSVWTPSLQGFLNINADGAMNK